MEAEVAALLEAAGAANAKAVAEAEEKLALKVGVDDWVTLVMTITESIRDCS
jgi:hypothetical protein